MSNNTGPDVRLAPASLSMSQIRAIIDMAQDFIREHAFHESIGEEDTYITGADLCADLQLAESQLYLYQQALKVKA